jgi:hypothetical protein
LGPEAGAIRFLLVASSQGRLNETSKQWVRFRRLRFKLRVALHRQKPGVIAQLDDLDQLAVGTGAGYFQTIGGKLLAKLVVELVTMAVAFVDQG